MKTQKKLEKQETPEKDITIERNYREECSNAPINEEIVEVPISDLLPSSNDRSNSSNATVFVPESVLPSSIIADEGSCTTEEGDETDELDEDLILSGTEGKWKMIIPPADGRDWYVEELSEPPKGEELDLEPFAKIEEQQKYLIEKVIEKLEQSVIESEETRTEIERIKTRIDKRIEEDFSVIGADIYGVGSLIDQNRNPKKGKKKIYSMRREVRNKTVSERVMLQATVNGKGRIAMGVDSLCCLTSMNASKYQELKSDMDVVRPYKGRPLISATGGVLTPEIEADMEIAIGDKTLTMRFLIVPELPYDCLLGRDAMEAWDMSISYGKKGNKLMIPRVGEFELVRAAEEDLKICAVRMVQPGHRLPPNSQNLMLVEVDSDIPDGTMGIVARIKNAPTGIIIAEQLVSVQKGKIPLRVANMEEHEVFIHPDQVLAGMEIVEQPEQLREVVLGWTESKKPRDWKFRPQYTHSIYESDENGTKGRIHTAIHYTDGKFVQRIKSGFDQEVVEMELPFSTVQKLAGDQKDMGLVMALRRLPEYYDFETWVDTGSDTLEGFQGEVEPELLEVWEKNMEQSLTTEQKFRLLEQLKKRRRAFPKKGEPGYCQLFEVTLDVPPGTRPINRRQYPLNPDGEAACAEELNKHEKNGVLLRRESEWNQPVLLVRKPNGKWRMVIDFRGINRLLTPISIPIPKIDDLLHTLGGNSYFSACDLTDGFHQLKLAEDSQKKTAFIYKGISYCYSRMPQGCRTSPGNFQLAMQLVLRGLHWETCLVYLDDVIIYSKSFDEHLTAIDKVLQRFEKARMTVKPEKCFWGKQELRYLGHWIGVDGIRPCENKLEEIRNSKLPKTKKQMASFLGKIGFYAKFIPQVHRLSGPLYGLKAGDRDRIELGDQELRCFHDLRTFVKGVKLLKLPDYEKEFSIAVDTDEIGLCVALMQKPAKGIGPQLIEYRARKWKGKEGTYVEAEQVALGIIWALGKFKQELYHKPFVVYTRCTTVRYLLESNAVTTQQAKYALLLADHQFELKVVSAHTMGRYMSYNQNEKYELKNEGPMVACLKEISEVRVVCWAVERISDLFGYEGRCLQTKVREFRPEVVIILEHQLDEVGMPVPRFLKDYVIWMKNLGPGGEGISILTKIKPRRELFNAFSEVADGSVVCIEIDGVQVSCVQVLQGIDADWVDRVTSRINQFIDPGRPHIILSHRWEEELDYSRALHHLGLVELGTIYQDTPKDYRTRAFMHPVDRPWLIGMDMQSLVQGDKNPLLSIRMSNSEAYINVGSPGRSPDPTVELFLTYDGGSRKDFRSAHSYILWSAEWIPIMLSGEFCRGRTNNDMEFSGLMAGLWCAMEFYPTKLRIFGDSQWLTRLVNGESEPNMIISEVQQRMIHETLEKIPCWSIQHIDRKLNAAADALCREAIDREDKISINQYWYEQVVKWNKPLMETNARVVSYSRVNHLPRFCLSMSAIYEDSLSGILTEDSMEVQASVDTIMEAEGESGVLTSESDGDQTSNADSGVGSDPDELVEEFRMGQLKVPWMEEMITYLTESQLPDEEQRGRMIRRKSEEFIMHQNMLHHVWTPIQKKNQPPSGKTRLGSQGVPCFGSGWPSRPNATV